jgi:hypothetical protein
MRHFLRTELGPPTLLPLGMLASALAAALVFGPCAAQRLAAPYLAAVAGAVDLPAIARRAHARLAAAERADEDPDLGQL